MTYNTDGIDRFTIHKPGRDVHFNCSTNGLYVHDFTNRDITLVQTVQENLEGFSKREIEMANRAKKLYHVMAIPSLHDFKNLIVHNMIKNCPITIKDVDNCENIYGKDVAALKGKVTEHKPEIVRTDYVELPPAIYDNNKNIVLCAHIFFYKKFLS